MQELKGRCAVVTGGGGLLGRGMALAFAREGMNVVVASLHQEKAAATAAEVDAMGAKAVAVQSDVTDPVSMGHLAERAYDAFGAVHVLVNNAGAQRIRPFIDLTREDWHEVLSVQLGGVINGVLAFLPRLLAQGGERHIVNMASMSGVGRADLRLGTAPYVTAKRAVVGMTEVMAPSLAEHGIGVSVVCPGVTVARPPSGNGLIEFSDHVINLNDKTGITAGAVQMYAKNILTSAQVAEEILHGIRERRLYIFPHRASRGEVEFRYQQMMEGFNQAALTSPLMEEG